MNPLLITGTDTHIGKTVVSAMLTLALDGVYWKPVQSGIDGMVDARVVQKLTQLPDERFLPEKYVLSEPLSPTAPRNSTGWSWMWRAFKSYPPPTAPSLSKGPEA
jgi:dethiobiotin synthetase